MTSNNLNEISNIYNEVENLNEKGHIYKGSI